MKNLFLETNIPAPVKYIAGLFLFAALLNVVYFLVFALVNPIALMALVKAAISWFFAYGLLKLNDTWRTLTLFLGWLALVLTPIYLIVAMANPATMDFITETSMINAESLIFTGIVFGFLFGLALVITLNRPDVKAAFDAKAAVSDS